MSSIDERTNTMFETTDTDDSSIPPGDSSAGLRRMLWIAGGLLWVLVGVGLFVVWRMKHAYESAPAAQSSQPTADAPLKDQPPGAAVAAIPDPDYVEPTGVIADFTLTDRHEQEVSKDDLLGEPWVAGFIFTRCAGPCFRVTGAMKELARKFDGTDLQLVTFTVDPDFDTPEVLTNYADAFDADENRWMFLTGDKAEIYTLILKSFLLPVEEMSGSARVPGAEVVHSTRLVLVDRDGKIVGKYDALNEVESARLRREIKKLVEPKADPTVDQER